MHMLLSVRRAALMLAVAAFVVGCDGFESGVPPNEVTDDTESTLAFVQEDLSITEEESPVSIEVTLNDPPGTEVSGEVLYANEVSDTDASDFNFSEEAAVQGGNAYVAGSISFPANAEAGATRSIELDIQDEEENEDQEDGVFVLQNVQGASIGSPDRMTISIGAIELFFEDFSDEELAPMTAYSVSSNEDWSVSSAGGASNVPYAVANGYGADEASNEWLITPALNFNEFEDEALSFLNAKNFSDSGFERAFWVKVSTDYDGEGNPEDFTWVDVSDRVENYSEGDFNFVSSGEVDLSDEQFQDETVYVAFQYRSTSPDDAAAWEVDNVRIVGR